MVRLLLVLREPGVVSLHVVVLLLIVARLVKPIRPEHDHLIVALIVWV